MKKIIYYIIGIAIIVTIGIIIYIMTTKPTLQENQIIIQTKQGAFPINDLKKLPGAQPLSSNDTLFQSNPEYDIVYFDFGTTDRSFLIDIKSSAVVVARQKAEEYFLQSLKITKEQACLLNVSLRVSKDANENLAGEEFGLSFCPNGKPFPTK